MPCTVLSTRDSWVNKINDHCPYGHKKRRMGRIQKLKSKQTNKNPNIMLKARFSSQSRLEFVHDCISSLLLL